MKLQRRITAVSTSRVEAGVRVLLELEHGGQVEMTFKPEAFEVYRARIVPGEVLTMRTNGPAREYEWGSLPPIAG